MVGSRDGRHDCIQAIKQPGAITKCHVQVRPEIEHDSTAVGVGDLVNCLHLDKKPAAARRAPLGRWFRRKVRVFMPVPCPVPGGRGDLGWPRDSGPGKSAGGCERAWVLQIEAMGTEASTLEDLAERLAAAADEVRELADEARELLEDELERAGTVRVAQERREARADAIPVDDAARRLGLSEELTQIAYERSARRRER